jgi:hypothetical protein
VAERPGSTAAAEGILAGDAEMSMARANVSHGIGATLGSTAQSGYLRVLRLNLLTPEIFFQFVRIYGI